MMRRVLELFFLIALISCAPIYVNSDYDPSVDFSGFRTYDWIPGPQGKTGNRRIDNPIVDSRIRMAVENQLREQGFVKKTNGSADFWVGYHAAVQSKLDVNTIDTYYGYGRRWGGGVVVTETQVYEYDEGTLVIDIVDPKTRKLVWRGSAQAEVNISKKPEKRQERVNKAVRMILNQFPPQ